MNKILNHHQTLSLWINANQSKYFLIADRKSNRMRAIMTHVLGITGLQPGSA
jgi:hypothetical protein